MKTISYSKFGRRMGRLGNSMFQLASLYGMSKRFNRKLALPEWNYAEYFTSNIDIIPRGDFKEDIAEPSYSFSGWDYWKKQFEGKDHVSVTGWLQSPKYWAHYRSDISGLLFNFTPEFKYRLYEQYSHIFSNNKHTILIGIRVAEDYVDNGNYEILDIKYQLGALYKYFPNWEQENNIIVFSDNYDYAKRHLDCHESIYFAEGLSDIEQLCLGTFCDHFIIPNSTFSWWQAYLGQKPDSVVIYPSKYFKGYLQETHSTKDFWPEDWISYDYRGERFNFNDVAFTIPTKYDHSDRVENLKLCLDWINKNFITYTYISEQGGSTMFKNSYGCYGFSFFKGDIFHRTKMLNEMASEVLNQCKIVINFDCDNICSILQMKLGVDAIMREEADMVYPYDGRVARLNRVEWYRKLRDTGGDVGILGSTVFKGTRPFDPKSVGHIIIWNRERFFEGGGENENFISYGPEDVERYERFNKLGYKILRIKGIVYHIDHWCGPDSGGSNPMFGKNYEELEKIRGMSKKSLREYVNTWPQTKKPL